jgi:hypothetical protein
MNVPDGHNDERKDDHKIARADGSDVIGSLQSLLGTIVIAV